MAICPAGPPKLSKPMRSQTRKAWARVMPWPEGRAGVPAAGISVMIGKSPGAVVAESKLCRRHGPGTTPLVFLVHLLAAHRHGVDGGNQVIRQDRLVAPHLLRAILADQDGGESVRRDAVAFTEVGFFLITGGRKGA